MNNNSIRVKLEIWKEDSVSTMPTIGIDEQLQIALQHDDGQWLVTNPEPDAFSGWVGRDDSFNGAVLNYLKAHLGLPGFYVEKTGEGQNGQ